MIGKQLNLYIKAGHYHEGQPLEQWTLLQARQMGIMGGTLLKGTGGYGHDRLIDFGRLNDDGESSVVLSFIVSNEHCEQLLARLKSEQIEIFYAISDAEFGLIGRA